jgi:hypothetical protein
LVGFVAFWSLLGSELSQEDEEGLPKERERERERKRERRGGLYTKKKGMGV